MRIMEAQNLAANSEIDQLPQPSPIIVNKASLRTLKRKVFLQLFRILNQKTRNPIKSMLLLDQFKKKYQSIFGETMLSKASKVDNRFYFRLGSPGFPSTASKRVHQNEISRLLSPGSNYGLRTLFIAITKQCPLDCEHCFEWDNLNKMDQLSTSDIIRIVHEYQNYGTTQIMFSGGEPMMRKNDLYKILDKALPGTDFWIITSGLGLTLETAQVLKKHGLTGVMVSLDHHKAEKHNQFRGNKNAYKWATEAVMNSNKAGLVTTLSLCAAREFVNEGNFSGYMNLAKDLGVTFVQILEPRAAGRYKGLDVKLGDKELEILDHIYLTYNSSSKFREYPIVNSLGYHQRKVGCFGGGNRFFYIDTDGDAHICPYCTEKTVSVLQNTPEEVIGKMAEKSCHVFEKSVV
ncbi:radical SAM protein [Lutimonas vermicola]|uniref:Radical SAM protein n=1 Tax=Lutimonas vermicola TaxID=414288 RepID=A0ABU9L5L4_9FLAO